MKKRLIGLLVGVLVLGLLTLVVTREEQPPPTKQLTLEGYASEAELEQQESQQPQNPMAPGGGSDIDHPIDVIHVERPSGTVHLERNEDADDGGWRLTKPVESPAMGYRIDKMVGLFKTDLSSVHSEKVPSEKDLTYYDLEPDRRIHVRLESDGEVWHGVDLRIGKVADSEIQTGEGETREDTWVAKADEPLRVYRIAGKNLREPFETSLGDLRDKNFLAVGAKELTRIAFRAPAGEKLVLKGERTEKKAKQGKKKGKTTIQVDWSVAEPSGVRAGDDLGRIARNLASARTKAYVPMDEAPEDPLGQRPWTVTLRTHDGTSHTLTVAAEGDPVWARLDERDEFLKLSPKTADGLRKRIQDVRHKGLVDAAASAVEELRLPSESDGQVVLRRNGERWTFARPRGGERADPSDLLGNLVDSDAERYAYPGERDAARQALADPAYAATVTVSGERHELAFGSEIGEGDRKGKRWARVRGPDGERGPLLVSGRVADRFRTTADELRWRKLFTLEKGALQRIAIHPPKGEDAERGLVEKAPDSDELRPPKIPEGQEADSRAITELKSTLTSLEAESFAPEASPGEVGLTNDAAWRLEVTLEDGESLELLLSEQKKDGKPYALARGGPLDGRVVTLNGFKVDKLKKPADDLAKKPDEDSSAEGSKGGPPKPGGLGGMGGGGLGGGMRMRPGGGP